MCCPPDSARGERGERDRLDAGDLGRHDVHHHAGHERGDRHPARRGRRARPATIRWLTVPPGTTWVVTSCSSSASHVMRSRPDRLLEAGADLGVEDGQRRGHRRPGHGYVGLLDAVEPGGELGDRVDPTTAHVVADGTHDVECCLHVEVGARHHVAVVGDARTPEINATDHVGKSRVSACASSCPSSP